MTRCCADVARFAGLELEHIAHKKCGLMLDIDLIAPSATARVVRQKLHAHIDSVIFHNIRMQPNIARQTKRVEPLIKPREF